MATGIEASDEVGAVFNDFKLQKAPYNLRYITYEIKNNVIEIEKQGARSETWDDFCASLPENDARYAVIDVEFETDDGRPTSKILFLAWVPEGCKIKSKMTYAGSKEAIKRVLMGVSVSYQANGFDELDFDTCILPAVKKFA